ncbi:MAG: hypothetical protein RL122_2782 [Pseudomonadota bacterium]|jgi:uncharacterized protein (DUF302 family)|uniref:DUF302 domain-containing protein n=1 Tax=Thiothrix fructosivorans TaxID=111770 RepID=A0A8B0SK44_9GAMM|nr:DUF302 domain-containing protein [Thiothrix fructosivorans]MBO0613096.1 DUF302 domain-containing protein [Thiothrix fructosivorans]QTX11461.1 DUF302 domain-containing protein [Thiothrix fructosivorans]
MSYEFNTTLQGSFDEAVEKVRAVLMEEHLGVVSEVNVQAIFKNKMDKDIPPYRIFGACNPKLASQILDVEPNAGTLLPCNFIMYETTPGNVVVSFMDPVTVLGLAESAAAHEVGQVAKEKLLRVVAKLAA